jgi:hypothetical protein
MTHKIPPNLHLHLERVRLRYLTGFRYGALQWFDGARLVEVKHRVELLGQPDVEVVARAPRLFP